MASSDGSPEVPLSDFCRPSDDADVILRSTDDVDLFAHTLMLKRVSLVFAACFATAVPSGSSTLPVVPLPAEARVIDFLLQHIYPEYEPEEIPELEELIALLDLSISYQVHTVVNKLRRQLVKPSFLDAQSIRIFSLASQWELAEEAEVAAEATGALELGVITPLELQSISAVDYVRLVRRHRQRKSEITKAIDFWHSRRCKTCQLTNSWATQFRLRALAELHRTAWTKIIFSDDFMKRHPVTTTCATCDNHFTFEEHWRDLRELSQPTKSSFSNPRSHSSGSSATSQPPSPIGPVFEEGDCILRSSDNVDFHAYKRILMEASPFWKTMCSLPQPDDDSSSSLAVIDCQEDSFTLSRILQIIYPIPKPEFSTLDEIERVLETARKFEMDAILQHLTNVLHEPRFLQDEAVRVYALAYRFELLSLVRPASFHSLRKDLDETPEESVVGLSASSFMRLIQWRNSRASKMFNILLEQRAGPLCQGRLCDPRWPSQWIRAAMTEVLRRPVTDIIFSFPFLMKSMEMERPVQQAHYCAATITEADQTWLRNVKRLIDSIPDFMEDVTALVA